MNTKINIDAAAVLGDIPIPLILDVFRDAIAPLVKEYEQTSKLSWFGKWFFSDHYVIELKITTAFNNLTRALDKRGPELAEALPIEIRQAKAAGVPEDIITNAIVLHILSRTGVPETLQDQILLHTRN